MKDYRKGRDSNKENGVSRHTSLSRMPLADITNEVSLLRRPPEDGLAAPLNPSTTRSIRQTRTGTATEWIRSSGGQAFASLASNTITSRRDSENLQSSDESSLGDRPVLSLPITRRLRSSRPAPSRATMSSTPLPSDSCIPDPARQLFMTCNQVPCFSAAGYREPWTTAQVPPKTHKTTSGQLVILPSHATLVDFREGERRKGEKGDEVIVVSSDGLMIQIFSAPHLSTPCCLAEPHVTYTLDALPSSYYKLYEQARKIIDRVKRRIPRLVMYEVDSTCTLMINGPQADIQVSLDARAGAGSTPAVRVRLSRKLLNVEISTATGTHANGGEWSRKVLFWHGRDEGIGPGELRRLDTRQRHAIQVLRNFLFLVEHIEGLHDPQGSSAGPIVMDNRKNLAGIGCKRTASHTTPKSIEHVIDCPVTCKRGAVAFPPNCKTRSAVFEASSVPSIAELTVSPRPRLGLGAPPVQPTPVRKVSSTAVDSRPQSAITQESGGPKMVLSPVSASVAGVDMRFLPSVGWCIRLGEGVGTYRIMFFDGAMLEIGIEDEHVEFMAPDGDVERFAIRDSHAQRNIGDRMKAFEEFVSLFEDEDS
ncbi:hypothetical protein K488DRAFT_72197 [Vararia minispora EC-137]|uniref:Uncharacterized protein n=1 Tax=Vararia minispora EC-137 TaxID=1314806 RepID=A0ACB8QF28_9AGAM|nr:hypothetical protein K488DRAFT_72197 [Vararia minispora EC-137]